MENLQPKENLMEQPTEFQLKRIQLENKRLLELLNYGTAKNEEITKRLQQILLGMIS